MTDDAHEEDIPEWVLTLGKKPIRVLDSTPDDVLTDAMEERLTAIMRRYGCEPTPEGWRELALTLALSHEPALRIETPVDRRHGEGGAEPTIEPFIWRSKMASAMKRLGSKKAAAEYLSKTAPNAPSTAALQNLVTPAAMQKAKATGGPRQWRRDRYELRAETALRRAAVRIEESQK